jgi:hypothetical protein
MAGENNFGEAMGIFAGFDKLIGDQFTGLADMKAIVESEARVRKGRRSRTGGCTP